MYDSDKAQFKKYVKSFADPLKESSDVHKQFLVSAHLNSDVLFLDVVHKVTPNEIV